MAYNIDIPLEQAYGFGNTITVTNGSPFSITKSSVDATNAISISVTGGSGSGISATMGGSSTGAAILVSSTSGTVGLSSIGSALLAIGNGTAGNTSGALSLRRSIVAKTTNYVVATSDTNTLFTTTGASAEVDFSLPASALGLQYTFVSDAAQILKVIANGTDIIRFGELSSAAGGNIATTTSGRGDVVRIVAHASGAWVVEAATGSTWSVT